MHILIRYSFFLALVISSTSGCLNETKDQTATKALTPVVKEEGNEERPQKDPRMSWQKPSSVISALGAIENKTIADLGAGIGYFSFKLLPKAEKVIAIEIDTQKIEILDGFKNTLNQNLQDKFETRLASPQNANLKSAEVDIIFIVNTIAYLQPRVQYLSNLIPALKPGGKIFIVDYKNKRLPDYVPAPEMSNRVYMNILEDQLEHAGFKLIESDDTSLEFQYMISAEI